MAWHLGPAGQDPQPSPGPACQGAPGLVFVDGSQPQNLGRPLLPVRLALRVHREGASSLLAPDPLISCSLLPDTISDIEEVSKVSLPQIQTYCPRCPYFLRPCMSPGVGAAGPGISLLSCGGGSEFKGHPKNIGYIKYFSQY